MILCGNFVIKIRYLASSCRSKLNRRYNSSMWVVSAQLHSWDVKEHLSVNGPYPQKGYQIPKSWPPWNFTSREGSVWEWKTFLFILDRDTFRKSSRLSSRLSHLYFERWWNFYEKFSFLWLKISYFMKVIFYKKHELIK